MEKVNGAVKRKLKKQYEEACNGYVTELLRMWELDAYYGYWISDEIGGEYDYDGNFTISMEDIIYCVENDVTEEQYMQWLEYIIDAAEFGFETPNLRPFLKGCPVTSKETFKRLQGLKADLYKAAEEEKERVVNETMEWNRIVEDDSIAACGTAGRRYGKK